MLAMPMASSPKALWREWPLLLDVATAALFLAFGKAWLADLSSPRWFAFLLGWLLAVILLSAFGVVRHAESLAVRLGEPLGTLVLTLSVTGIEAMLIASAMFTAGGSPALARDSMFAVIMIVLNGMVGLSLLLGGLRYREQEYNLQGANAFLAVIIPLAVLGLVLPNFTRSTIGPTFAPFQALLLIVMSLGLYGVFLAIQNARHREYFQAPPGAADGEDVHAGVEVRSTPFHGIFLAAYLIPLVFLCKQLGQPLDHGIRVLGAPPALGGFLVASLVLSPESLSAIRAAQANHLQRAVNLLLGSVLATISLTVPAVLTIGLVLGKPIVLGLEPAGITLLALTLVLSLQTFTGGRTNVLLGVVHLLLFAAYTMLLFD
jgi:Ca2+:H+ antiporter